MKKVKMGTGLLVDDIKRQVEFYQHILGFDVIWDGGDFAEVITGNGELTLFLYSRKEFVKTLNTPVLPSSPINQTFELAIWLENYAEVDLEYERLKKLNVNFPFGSPITFPFGIRNFYVVDPDGNLIEIGSSKKTV